MDIRVIHTLDPAAIALLRDVRDGLHRFPSHKDFHDMRASLLAAIAASQALAAQETTLESSIKAYVSDEPKRTAAAVAEALAAADVDDDTAAGLIEAASATSATSVADSLAAITAPGPGTDTTNTGDGNDTVNAGGGGDTVTDPTTPTDTVNGGQGDDVVSVDPNAQ